MKGGEVFRNEFAPGAVGSTINDRVEERVGTRPIGVREIIVNGDLRL